MYAEGLDIAWAQRHGAIKVKAGSGEIAPHLKQHAEQPMTLWIQRIERDRLLRVADSSFPPTLLLPRRGPAG